MASKDTKGKLRLNLVPNKGLEAVARVREFGNNKYPSGGSNNYLDGTVKVDDLIEAIKRHALKHTSGELLDVESGEMHLAHIATGAMMAIEIIHSNLGASGMSLRGFQSLFKGMYEYDYKLTTEIRLDK